MARGASNSDRTPGIRASIPSASPQTDPDSAFMIGSLLFLTEQHPWLVTSPSYGTLTLMKVELPNKAVDYVLVLIKQKYLNCWPLSSNMFVAAGKNLIVSWHCKICKMTQMCILLFLSLELSPPYKKLPQAQSSKTSKPCLSYLH